MWTDLQIGLWIAVTGFALWRGPPPARIVAVSLLFGLALSMIFWRRVDPYGLKLHLLLADFVALAACGWALVKTRSRWAAAACAFQSLSLLTQLAKALDPTILSWSYLTLGIVWGYGVLGSFLSGVLMQRRQ